LCREGNPDVLPTNRSLGMASSSDAAHMLAIETNGHPVTTEHDPGSALERAGHEAFDAFLLDIGLPAMDGNELVRRLRAMPPARTAVMGHNRR
jgi:CheY-like chemotaxis protein